MIDDETAIVGPRLPRTCCAAWSTGSAPMVGCGAPRSGGGSPGAGSKEVRAPSGTRSPRCSLACHDDGHHWSGGRDQCHPYALHACELFVAGSNRCPLLALPAGAGQLLTCLIAPSATFARYPALQGTTPG